MLVISMINVKGGVGKTITSINLAGAISKSGKSVLLIDNDSQSSVSQICDIEPKKNKSMYNIYTNNKLGFEDCIYKYADNFFVVPNTIESALLESSLHNRITRESILKNKRNTIPPDMDYVIVDNSPFLGLCVSNSLGFSDYYIEVIDNSTSALRGLSMVDKIVKEIKESMLNMELKKLGILRNRFDSKTNYTKQFKNVLEKKLGKELFKNVVSDSTKYREASAMNKTIQEYSPPHACVYDGLLDEIIERIKKY